MQYSDSFPTLSIVLEWENAKSSELGRARDMLAMLLAQLKQLSPRFRGPPEIILVYDSGDGAAESVLEQVKGEMTGFQGVIRALPTSGLDYYEQKNLGASEARSDLILFLDSDVIPEEGWLESLITALLEEDADVSGGCAHMPTGSFYEKSFAAFWFFPVRGEMPHREVYGAFAANNVLFKTNVAREHPFPKTDQIRGRCLVLARSLRETGHKIVMEPNARVTHPAPNGFSHFVKRSLCDGQSQVLKRERTGPTLPFKQLYWNVKSSSARILSTREKVGLSPLGVAGAMGLATAYYGISCVGELITIVKPNFIRDHVRV